MREEATETGELREAAQRTVDATSLRKVAEQIGMSERALEAFLAGGAPPLAKGRRKTRKRRRPG
jgi:hypothetical protein